jgi:hypothetical protein
VPDQVWDMPVRRNNALLDSSFNFAPPPMEPPPPPADARDDEINARFQDVLRRQAETTSAINLLGDAIAASAAREIGIGHNQGPPVSFEKLDAEDKRLLALLQDKGPRPRPVDRALIEEQAEKTLHLSDRIRTWLASLAAEAAKLGAREVAKDLTASLWEDVARRIVDLFHAIQVWLSSLF